MTRTVAEPATPRLLALRLHGFKSFAERTVVEFGPGISAVVGPNGSGKSNLADALRWTLGEQGRALRSRKSEDVIFAGSERRAAVGMADVTLVLDNSDGLLPVEFRVLELGRRLYRSGENDYLLNRQRVRLKDLVDLLDAAHLADNAFLFIGQGMVDQALALRPEERRPLFEEVAGVRRHERRRRRAEEQLIEAEGNLARVEDILGELRPQARRLAAQAEQQATRETAGEQLAAALALVAHARWYEASVRAHDAAARLTRARGEVDRAIARLSEAESVMTALRATLAERATEERARRSRLDEAQARLTAVRIERAQLASEIAALERDAERLRVERDAAGASLESRRRQLAMPVPERDHGLETAHAEADRALADAQDELAGLRAARDSHGEAIRAARRAEAARQAELETARRRAADATERASRERAEAGAAEARRDDLAANLERARRDVATAVSAERAALDAREPLRAAADAAEAEARTATATAGELAGRVAALRGRVDALTARRREDESRAFAKRARRSGGRRIDEGIGLDPDLRTAVEAALGDTVHAYVVPEDVVASLAGDRGVAIADRGRPGGPATAAVERGAAEFLARVAEAGGGRLIDAVRNDPAGIVRRLVAATAWVPDLAALVAVQPYVPVGWSVVVRDGSAVAGALAVRFGRPDGALDRAAEEDRLARDLAALDGEVTATQAAADRARQAAAAARAVLAAAAAAENAAGAERRRAEDRERSAGRAAEAATREAAWHAAQADRFEAEAERLRVAFAALEADGLAATTGDVADATPVELAAIEQWEARVAERRARRDRVVADVAAADRVRREAEAVRAAAEAGAAMDQDRLARAEREADALAERRRQSAAASATAAAELATAETAEAEARAALAALLASDDADRAALARAEVAAVEQRERLRATEDRSRAAETADLQARLELDLVREQVLVELAGLGEVGLRALAAADAGLGEVGLRALDRGVGVPVMAAPPALARTDPGARTGAGMGAGTGADEAVEAALFEAALDGAARRWVAGPPDSDPPTNARLASLRRRYHDLGAANPFAATEYEEVRARLEALDTQDRDLREAIIATRTLIAELNTLIADQFRTTFRALEGAFDARFRQLFGGGYAKLSLTDPDDLASTGVEIVARPPGKKAQALAMLSGGERALTAVALLFAMLEVRPVPFCVLDEVDAALDEANVGRFTDALRSLAGTTQFIVITHNRGTIEAADALYGVTVGNDSASRVISLRLDEATALAAQGRGESIGEPELAAAG